MDEDEGGDLVSSHLKSDDCFECKLVKLEMPKEVIVNDYFYRPDTIMAKRNSYIYREDSYLKEKEDYHLSDDVNIYHRYLDSIDRLNESSIWLQDNHYKEVLESYIRKKS